MERLPHSLQFMFQNQGGEVKNPEQDAAGDMPHDCSDRLAWAKASTDPRIAVGQQSPLEKRILDLGGVHTAAARHLITQSYQEEHKTLCKEQAHSLDHWLARAESYYNKKLVEMRRKEELGHRAKTEMEGKATKSRGQKQCSCVPEREKQQIERHIHRTYQGREFRSKPSRKPQLSSEVVLPKIMSEKQSVSEAQRRKQAHRREWLQIQGHQARMARGRKLIEEKLQRRVLLKSPSPLLPPPPERPPTVRETKEFERITAYPLFQPRNTSRIKVDILIEKSQYGEEVCRVITPYQKKFLAVPPFLRSQLGKMKD